EAQPRLLLEQLVEHRDEQGSTEIVAHRHPQGLGWAAGELRKLGEEGLGLGAELEDAGERGLAGRGEPDAATGALEELHVQVALELANLLAGRRAGAGVLGA